MHYVNQEFYPPGTVSIIQYEQQLLKNFEVTLVAKIGNLVTATLFVEKMEHIPSLLKSLVERVQNIGGRASSKHFWNTVGPISLEDFGILINIRIPTRPHSQKYILAEIKIFADEVERSTSSPTNKLIGNWFQIVRKIELLLTPKAYPENNESFPWENTATSLKELYENAYETTPFFQSMCKDIASQANCVIGFDNEREEIKKRKVKLIDAMSSAQGKGTSISPKITLLKGMGIAAGVFLSIAIGVKLFQNINYNEIHEKIIANRPDISLPSPKDISTENFTKVGPVVDLKPLVAAYLDVPKISLSSCFCECNPITHNITNAPVFLNTTINNTEVQENPPTPNPCQTTITPYRIGFTGSCNDEQIESAEKEQEILIEANNKKIYEKALANTKKESEKGKKINDALKAEREVLIQTWTEKLRKLTNPTPDELAALYAKIDCYLDERFRGWTGYTSNCEVRKRLEICDGLHAEYIKFAKMYHPDRNKSPEAISKFREATDEYEVRCPPTAQEPRDPDPGTVKN